LKEVFVPSVRYASQSDQIIPLGRLLALVLDVHENTTAAQSIRAATATSLVRIDVSFRLRFTHLLHVHLLHVMIKQTSPVPVPDKINPD
jgi:hypothetical protein